MSEAGTGEKHRRHWDDDIAVLVSAGAICLVHSEMKTAVHDLMVEGGMGLGKERYDLGCQIGG